MNAEQARALPDFYIKNHPPIPRVVITGIGIIAPKISENGEIGIIYGRQEMNSVIDGGIPTYGPTPQHIRDLYVNPDPVKDSLVGAYFPKDFDAFTLAPDKEAITSQMINAMREPRSSKSARMAVLAAWNAVMDAGLTKEKLDPTKTGTAISTSTGPIELLETALKEIDYQKANPQDTEHLKRKYRAALMAAAGNGLSDETVRMVSKILGIRGFTINNVAACASFLTNLISATLAIRAGYANKMVVGGSETALSSIWANVFRLVDVPVKGFNNRPKEASRPGDKDRSGLVPSEGAIIAMVESLDEVVADGREENILLEVTNGMITMDQEGVTTKSNTATIDAITGALAHSGLQESGTDVTLPHMTSTIQGDEFEAGAILVSNPRTVIYPVKSLVGHKFAAAGGDCLIVAAKIFQDNSVPEPTNLKTPGTTEKGVFHSGSLGKIIFSFAQNHPKGKINTISTQAIGMQGVNAVVPLIRYKPDTQL